jgi:hypothetical protein
MLIKIERRIELRLFRQELFETSLVLEDTAHLRAARRA